MSPTRRTSKSATGIQVTPKRCGFNSTRPSFHIRDLLNVFFAIHDPTTLNRQGGDVGTQYRSAIFYHSPEQKETAETLIRELNAQKIWGSSIVTEVTAVDNFYVAEDYHQEYFAHNQFQPYCQAVVAPKVSKFRKHFLELLKK